jgi:hypothetical protein
MPRASHPGRYIISYHCHACIPDVAKLRLARRMWLAEEMISLLCTSGLNVRSVVRGRRAVEHVRLESAQVCPLAQTAAQTCNQLGHWSMCSMESAQVCPLAQTAPQTCNELGHWSMFSMESAQVCPLAQTASQTCNELGHWSMCSMEWAQVCPLAQTFSELGHSCCLP